MFRRLSTVFLLTLFAFSITALAGGRKLVRAQKVTPEDEAKWFENFQNLPDYPSAPAIENSGRQELGRTWYDYVTNQQMGRNLAHALDSGNGQDGIHFGFNKILPQAAERYVTYDYFDLNLSLFFGNASVDQSLGRSGWMRVINGRDDEMLCIFHSNTLGGIHIYQDAGEPFYTFSSVVDVITTEGAVFAGIARQGDNVVFMGQLSNGNWIGGDTVMVSTDYMQTWTGRDIVDLDPLTTDGGSEWWPNFNPTNSNVFSHIYTQDVSVVSPNGESRLATTSDLAATWSSVQIQDDDEVFQINGNATQYIVENFSQWNGMYTQDGVYHAVCGAVQGIKDTATSALNDLFPILYWNNRDDQLVEVTSDSADSPADTATINGLANFRPGNGLGNAYPHISEGPGGDLVVIWQQWEEDPSGGLLTVIPTGGGETFLTDIWGAYSPDGGLSWSKPFWVAGTAGESDVYPNITERFHYDANGDSVVLDIMYMWDTNAGTSVFASPNSSPSETIFYYERVAIAFNNIIIVGIDNPVANIARNFKLAQNYPNPFNPATTITFNLTKTTNVSLEVFNLLGEKVATLVNGRTTAGEHTLQFDATNLSSGIYFYTLTANNLQQTRKMILMK